MKNRNRFYMLNPKENQNIDEIANTLISFEEVEATTSLHAYTVQEIDRMVANGEKFTPISLKLLEAYRKSNNGR